MLAADISVNNSKNYLGVANNEFSQKEHNDKGLVKLQMWAIAEMYTGHKRIKLRFIFHDFKNDILYSHNRRNFSS